MTATAPAAESTQMSHTPDPPAAAADAQTAAAGGRIRAILGDHPLLTALATLAVAMLVYEFAQIHNRIDRLEDTMNTEFAAQDAKIDEKFGELDAKIDEINLKLTALIAALNKTGEVDAAMEGRRLDSKPAVGDPDAAPG